MYSSLRSMGDIQCTLYTARDILYTVYTEYSAPHTHACTHTHTHARTHTHAHAHIRTRYSTLLVTRSGAFQRPTAPFSPHLGVSRNRSRDYVTTTYRVGGRRAGLLAGGRSACLAAAHRVGSYAARIGSGRRRRSIEPVHPLRRSPA